MPAADVVFGDDLASCFALLRGGLLAGSLSP
jgi:hypothetical protein